MIPHPPGICRADGGGTIGSAEPARQALRPLPLPQGRHARLHQGGAAASRELYPQFQKLGVEVVGLSKDTVDQPRQVQEEICPVLPARLPTRRARRGRGARRLGREEHVRQEVHGHRPLDLPGRRRRPDRAKPGAASRCRAMSRRCSRPRRPCSRRAPDPMCPRTLDARPSSSTTISLRSALREHPAQRALRRMRPTRLQRRRHAQLGRAGACWRFLIELTGARARARGRLLHRLRHAGPGPGAAGGRPRRHARRQRRLGRARPPLLAARRASPSGSSCALGLALDSLDQLLAEGAAGSFDLAYVDADKKPTTPTTSARSDWCARAASWRSTTCSGTARSPTPPTRTTQTGTMRALNAKIHADERVSAGAAAGRRRPDAPRPARRLGQSPGRPRSVGGAALLAHHARELGRRRPAPGTSSSPTMKLGVPLMPSCLAQRTIGVDGLLDRLAVHVGLQPLHVEPDLRRRPP